PALPRGGVAFRPVFPGRAGTAAIPAPARPLLCRGEVAEPVVVPAELVVGRRSEPHPTRTGQPAGDSLDGTVGARRRNPRHAVRLVDPLLRLAWLHPDAPSRGRVALQPRRDRYARVHRPELMTRSVRLAAQALAVALVVGLLALLVWRVARDNNKGISQALASGDHPTAPAFDLTRLDGRGR